MFSDMSPTPVPPPTGLPLASVCGTNRVWDVVESSPGALTRAVGLGEPTAVALTRCPKPLLMSSPSRQPLLPCGSVSQLAWARPSARVAFRTGSRAIWVLLYIIPLFGGAVAVAFWVMRALAVATGLFWPIPSSTPAPRAPDFLVGSAPWMTVLILLSI